MTSIMKIIASAVAIAAMSIQTVHMAKQQEPEQDTTVLTAYQDILDYTSADDKCYYLYQPNAEYEPFICIEKDGSANAKAFKGVPVDTKMLATFKGTDLWEIETVEVWR